MEIKINYIDGIGVAKISGELDAKSSPELTNLLNNEIANGNSNFVIDLEDLEYSSSAGIRIFLGSARSSRQNGGDLRIAAAQPQVAKIFKLSRFDKIVRVFDTCDEAVKSFNE